MSLAVYVSAHQAAPRHGAEHRIGHPAFPHVPPGDPPRPPGSAASAVVRKTCPRRRSCSSTRAWTCGSSSDSASSSSSTGRAADRPRHRPHLGQAQGEGQQPLLAARAVEAAGRGRPPRSAGRRGAARPASGRGAPPRETARSRAARNSASPVSGPRAATVLELHRARAGQRRDRARAPPSRGRPPPRRRRATSSRPTRASCSFHGARAPREPAPGAAFWRRWLRRADDLAIPAERRSGAPA